MQEFLESLGIDEALEDEDGQQVIKLTDSNEFQDIFEYLQGVDNVSLDEDSVEFNNDYNKVTFQGEKYNLTLEADFVNDKYRVKVEE